MSMYRKEWACCGSVTETDAWEPDSCPFCTPDRSAQPVMLSDEQVKQIAGCLRGASTMGWITEETAQELSAILAAKEQA